MAYVKLTVNNLNEDKIMDNSVSSSEQIKNKIPKTNCETSLSKP